MIMGLKGAILGDIIGSRWEFVRPRNLDWKNIELFSDECMYTDDTVMSIATKWALDNDKPFAEAYQKFGRMYPRAGYGGMFNEWIYESNPQPYGSFGNGSAMRVSYVADKFYNLDDVIKYATMSAECTHNHPEGIKGAVVTAVCSFMAQRGATKEEIFDYALEMYGHEYEFSVIYSLEELREFYRWDVSCQGSVPVAIRCFIESEDYESCIRNVLSLRCDSDTLGAISGCIAESYYGRTGFDDKLKDYLDYDLMEYLNR